MRISEWSSDVCSSDLIADDEKISVLARKMLDPSSLDRVHILILVDQQMLHPRQFQRRDHRCAVEHQDDPHNQTGQIAQAPTIPLVLVRDVALRSSFLLISSPPPVLPGPPARIQPRPPPSATPPPRTSP